MLVYKSSYKILESSSIKLMHLHEVRFHHIQSENVSRKVSTMTRWMLPVITTAWGTIARTSAARPVCENKKQHDSVSPVKQGKRTDIKTPNLQIHKLGGKLWALLSRKVILNFDFASSFEQCKRFRSTKPGYEKVFKMNNLVITK